MVKKLMYKQSLYFTGIVTVCIWSLLLWNNSHGGVPGHHILHQENLPKISNWWSGLLLPLLTLFLTYRIRKRLIRTNDNRPTRLKLPKEYTYRFLFALLFGVLLSVLFTLGYSDLSSYLIYGLVPLAFFFQIYRAECLLGFVIGMTVTFGAVLPTAVGAIFALVAYVLYQYVRTALIFLVKKIIILIPTNKDNSKK